MHVIRWYWFIALVLIASVNAGKGKHRILASAKQRRHATRLPRIKQPSRPIEISLVNLTQACIQSSGTADNLLFYNRFFENLGPITNLRIISTALDANSVCAKAFLNWLTHNILLQRCSIEIDDSNNNMDLVILDTLKHNAFLKTLELESWNESEDDDDSNGTLLRYVEQLTQISELILPQPIEIGENGKEQQTDHIVHGINALPNLMLFGIIVENALPSDLDDLNELITAIATQSNVNRLVLFGHNHFPTHMITSLLCPNFQNCAYAAHQNAAFNLLTARYHLASTTPAWISVFARINRTL